MEEPEEAAGGHSHGPWDGQSPAHDPQVSERPGSRCDLPEHAVGQASGRSPRPLAAGAPQPRTWARQPAGHKASL